MMMSPIGSKKSSQSGLSFIEAIAAVTILSVGILFVFKAFFVSLESMNRLAERAHILNAIDSRIGAIQDLFDRTKTLLNEPRELDIKGRKITVNYDIKSQKAETFDSLYEIDMTASWNNGQRESQLSHSFYIVDL